MIAIRTRSGIDYPDASYWFSPAEHYPEYRFGEVAGAPNPVYAMVRELLRDAGLDPHRFGTQEWNPLGGVIRPGARVFVLCNFVYHRRPKESESDFQAKCIHGSVLRALLDYVLLATGPGGTVRFGNAPLQGCRWEAVLAETGAGRVAEFYRRRGAPVEAKDLRLVVIEGDFLGRVTSRDTRDDSRDAVEIDLAAESLLAELASGVPARPRFRVADYDPRRTEAFHQGSSHRYVIHRAILESDVVISLSKLKTHEKVGITCGLKGFVGTVGHKDCLAHHRLGSAEQGGDEYPRSLRFLQPLSRFQDWLWKRPQGAPMQGPLQITDRTLRRSLRRLGAVQGGAWHGNETCWRMTLDLARIVYHADLQGKMHDTPRRTHLSLIDGIVAGEGDGPLAPDAVRAGVLVLGDEVARTDRVACRLMGFEPGLIPLIREAFRPDLRWGIATPDDGDGPVIMNGCERAEKDLMPVVGRPFRPSLGWREHLGSAA